MNGAMNGAMNASRNVSMTGAMNTGPWLLLLVLMITSLFWYIAEGIDDRP